MKKHSAKTMLAATVLTVMMVYADAGLAEVNVNIGIGVPLPRVVFPSLQRVHLKGHSVPVHSALFCPPVIPGERRFSNRVLPHHIANQGAGRIRGQIQLFDLQGKEGEHITMGLVAFWRARTAIPWSAEVREVTFAGML